MRHPKLSDGRAVASNVKVFADGGFTTAFTIAVIPGDRDLTATWHTSDWDSSATGHLIVLPNGSRSTPPAHTKNASPGRTNATDAGATPQPHQQPRSTGVGGPGGTTPTSGGSGGWWLAGGILILLAGAVAAGLVLRAWRSASA